MTARLGLIQDRLMPGERIVDHIPADLISEVGPNLTNPCILWLTDRRVIWTAYDPAFAYKPVDPGSLFAFGSIPLPLPAYSFGTVQWPRNHGRWRGAATFMHNIVQWRELDPATQSQHSRLEHAWKTHEEAFGDEGPKWLTVMNYISMDIDPLAYRYCVTFGLRQWNDITERVTAAIEDSQSA